ncbi:MAG TPA: hypothetical protein VHU15_10335, partial [Stellaceae bacterium]|nr:hypothetical protein [Stellaceae bacterium]
ADPDAPGAAIGIDVGGAVAEIAISVGGNAAILADREGFEMSLPVPAAPDGDWRHLFEGAKLRAERALARPVTHAVLALGAAPNADFAAGLADAAGAVGLELLRLVPAAALAAGEPRACAAAVLAEDLAPRPEAL